MGWNGDFFDSAVIEIKRCLCVVLAVDPTILLARQGFVETSGAMDTILEAFGQLGIDMPYGTAHAMHTLFPRAIQGECDA